uniref:Apple domain-containing protein n=1 Tax=Kalanchoe fedtschenkoi TaxID=63787 RepID=A0A7N0V1U4_KALFE
MDDTSTASSVALLLLLLLHFILLLSTSASASGGGNGNVVEERELLKGFKASPDPSTHDSFHPLLTDSTLTFSFGFFRVEQTGLALAVLHLPSAKPLWLFQPAATPPRWSKSVQLTFNGSLVISDHGSGVVWSSETNGDRVFLSNTSNLMIQSGGNLRTTLWQSFDFPADTLVENQNMTSNMTLTSPNGKYVMKLGDKFFGLSAEIGSYPGRVYWKHKAMEIKAKIIDGQGPIRIQINSDGYLGMYQASSVPVDIQPFNSFHRSVDSLLILKLESDGNLRGYSWNGTSWELNYEAIQSLCDLPSPCGPLGICVPGKGCACVDERVDFSETRQCSSRLETVPTSVAACSGSVRPLSVLRKTGVELAFKEYMDFKTTPSVEQCESLCERNCSCLGAVYSNSSGFCYILDSVIQGLVSVGDESRVGYFKVWEEGVKGHKTDVGFRVLVGVGIVAVLGILGAIGFLGYKVWRRRRSREMAVEEEGEVGTGLYKHLDSFRSIELSLSSRRMDV